MLDYGNQDALSRLRITEEDGTVHAGGGVGAVAGAFDDSDGVGTIMTQIVASALIGYIAGFFMPTISMYIICAYKKKRKDLFDPLRILMAVCGCFVALLNCVACMLTTRYIVEEMQERHEPGYSPDIIFSDAFMLWLAAVNCTTFAGVYSLCQRYLDRRLTQDDVENTLDVIEHHLSMIV